MKLIPWARESAAQDHAYSPAQSDALQAMLVEMDGMIQDQPSDGPPSYVLCAAMTNRPDRVDEAVKRPGRFDLVLSMPEVSCDSAEDVMAIYAQGDALPWWVDGEIRTRVTPLTIRQQLIRPALARVFGGCRAPLQDRRAASIDVTAGQIMANVHFKAAMNDAKKRAALRQLHHVGVPAVTADDVVDCLTNVAADFARQMEADPQMLVRQLNIKVPVAGVEVVPIEELQQHRYLQQDNS